MDRTARKGYYSPGNCTLRSIFYGFFIFSLLLPCAAEQTPNPPEEQSAGDLPDPKVAVGFDYPVQEYSSIKLGFLQKFVRPIGCPVHYHPGEDVFKPPGTEIYSTANGVVVFAGYQNKFSGYVVIIEHVAPPGIKFKLPDGGEINKVWSAYYHMSKIDESNVALNKALKRRTRIGFMGDFPQGSGKRHHLHFEVRKKNLWNGSAYNYKKNSVCGKPKEWVEDKFVSPSKFIRLNRPKKSKETLAEIAGG